MKAHYQKVTVPTMFVTKGKHRVKQYDNNVVYLRDGDEFELELFNPTTKKVLAKIKLNDEYLDSGIVLRPGERVFLERYLNEARKFIFSTYSADKNDPNVREAIKDNGKVEAEFYQEQADPGNIVWINNSPNYYGWQNPDPCISPGRVFHVSDTTVVGSGACTLTSSGNIGVGESMESASYSYDVNTDGNVDMSAAINDLTMDMTHIADVQETGRVEKGSNSDQSFEHDSTSFNSWPSWNQDWTILPLSQKALVKEDLAVYCTGCGRKRKKSDNFCAKCGRKY